MCGIAGFCDFNKKLDKQTLVEMTDVLHHRGPDDSGYSFHENKYATIGLGHRRLSVLDLSVHGHQPMIFENLEIIYNGEVYNFKEIREELEKYNYVFYSESDTEVILKAYHKWGIKAVDKFNGMFAIVIYDKTNNKLLLIRDRSGVKPLYYYQKNNLFLFASELKSFHKHSYFEKELSSDGVKLYFQHGYILEPYTIFSHTYKLKSGHYMEVDLQSNVTFIHKYWDVIDAYNAPKIDISFEEAKNETNKLLKSACEYRMVADVPVGIFLSGGYDSSAVAAILQQDRTEKLKTFTIGFHEKKYNEAHHAKKVAEFLGTDHTEYYCTQKDAINIIPKLSEIYDEPFADNSIIPTILVSQLARKDVTVSLSADGGDEIFGGYNKYSTAEKYYSVTRNIPIKKQISHILKTMKFDKLITKKNQYYKIIGMLESENPIEVMSNKSSYFTNLELNTLLLTSPNNILTSLNNYNELNTENDIFNALLAIDYKTYQVDNILTKIDRASMSVSLESRNPLLDYRIIEFVSKLPSKYKINKNDKKILLKEIIHDYIPKSIMDRPKMGFNIPLTEWFAGRLKEYVIEYLDSNKIKQCGIFNLSEVERLKKNWIKNDNIDTHKVWSILLFMMWYEKWM